MPYLKEKQDSKMPQGLLWLLDLAQQPQAGPCFVPIPRTWHSPWKMPWKWICPGNSPSRGASLSSWPPPGSFGAGHEGEICFNPKASPSEERELELYSSPGSGDESQSRGNAAQRRNRSSSSPGRDFSSPCTGEVAVPKLMDTQQNHQQDKKILAVFTHTFGVTTGNIFASGDTKVQSSGHWGF